MAASSILKVLAEIPWKDVVRNAPIVAEAAIKLWDSVSNRKSTRAKVSTATKALSATDQLRLEVDELAQELITLQQQMQASSQLIKDLAEQNSFLVQRVELNRVKHLRLVIALGVGILAGLALAILQMVRT